MNSPSTIDDRFYPVAGFINERKLSNTDIRDAELERARHALAYLKQLMGNEAMRSLLTKDCQAMQAKVRGWVEESNGQWRSATLQLRVHGPKAREFQDWYTTAMMCDREVGLRAGHPEHFVSHPVA